MQDVRSRALAQPLADSAVFLYHTLPGDAFAIVGVTVEQSTEAAAQPIKDEGAKQRQQPALSEPTKKASVVLSLLGGGLGGVLVTAAVSAWLFYAKWPVEREQMLAETRKTVEETAQTQLQQELTKAQTEQTKVQTEVERLDKTLRELEAKYYDSTRRLEEDSKIAQNTLTAINIGIARIEERTKARRDNNTLSIGEVQAAELGARIVASVAPNLELDCPGGQKETIEHIHNDKEGHFIMRTNNIILNYVITNKGSYDASVSPRVIVKDARGREFDNQPVVVSDTALPKGPIPLGSKIPGQLEIIYPQEWMDSDMDRINIIVYLKAITSKDVISTLAQRIGDVSLSKRLADNSSREFSCVIDYELENPLNDLLRELSSQAHSLQR